MGNNSSKNSCSFQSAPVSVMGTLSYKKSSNTWYVKSQDGKKIDIQTLLVQWIEILPSMKYAGYISCFEENEIFFECFSYEFFDPICMKSFLRPDFTDVRSWFDDGLKKIIGRLITITIRCHRVIITIHPREQ